MIRLAALMGLAALPAMAADLPDLDAVTKTINGAEVVVSGRITIDRRNPSIFTETGVHSVTLALDRKALASLDRCSMDRPCDIVAKAEIDVDGGRINLIVFELLSPPPAPAP